MFRRSVMKYPASKYKSKDIIRNIVEARNGTTTDWTCQLCDGTLKKTQFQLSV